LVNEKTNLENNRSPVRSDRVVLLPGDFLSTAEEYVPGSNAVEENGNLYSTVAGIKKMNDDTLVADVVTGRKKVHVSVGDIVYGQVIKGDRGMFFVRIGAVYKKERKLEEVDMVAGLRMDRDRDQNQFQEVRIGDIIRAKVTRNDSYFDITINGTRLGVIKALCYRCKNELILTKNGLWCDNCEIYEKRKVAPDYGNVVLEDELNENR
jgi:exosome complex component CSL4